MSRWKTKLDFIKWITRERNKHKTFHLYLIHDFNRYPKEYHKDITSEFTTSMRNASVNPIKIKSILNDKILEYLNAYLYNKDIEIFHIYTFFKAIKNNDFFKLSGFSSDSQEYKREVKQLKKRADKLQIFSKEQIIIQIPILPFITIYKMKTIFKRYGLSNDEIDIFTSYFGKRYRETKSYTLHEEKLNEIYFKNFLLKAKEVAKDSIERKIKYDGWNYRTEAEFQAMIKNMKVRDNFYYQKTQEESHYYKPLIK